MFPTPQNSSNELDRVLAEYLASQQKGGDPANGAPPAPSNFTLDINGRPMQFAGPEDASKVVSATVSAYEQQLASAKAEQEQLLARINEMSQNQFAAPQQDFNAPKPAIDPETFARGILSDPAKALAEANKQDPTIKELREELANAKRLTIEQQFVQRHPHYANPQAAKVIGGIIQQAGLQFSPEHLEIAVGFAQAQGLLPNEQVLAQQARAAQMAQMAQMFSNPAQPTVGGYENMPTQPPFAPQGQPNWPPPTGYPTAPPGGFSPTPMMQYGQNMSAPPPSPGRTGFGGGPTSLDQVNSVANTAPLGDLKAMIEKLQAQGVR